MSGVVFHHISEGVMAQSLKRSVDDAHDTASVVIPDVKGGDMVAAHYVLNQLGVKTDNTWNGSYTEGNPIWGTARRESQSVVLSQTKTGRGIVPNVTGMGARDAVFLLENIGIKTKVRGRGKVKSQSIFAGTAVKEGMVCELVLDN